MTERPILFSAPMVRALLAGTKMQTRRIVKPQPVGPFMPLISFNHGREEIAFGPENRDRSGIGPRWWRCPYGQLGDTLWVREAWQSDVEDGPLKPSEIPPGHPFFYAAGGSKDAGMLAVACAGFRPSIHMPRWASRISLRITDVRVERLNAISEADAKAEGLIPTRHDTEACWKWSQEDAVHYEFASSAYRALWEHINGPGSWVANPWVWCVSFERI